MIPAPNLDDLDYEALRTEAVGLLPSLCPTWTDFNPSDPGITLIELFAWLSELVMFRMNQVPDDHQWAFLALLNGDGTPGWPPPAGTPLDSAIRQTVAALRSPYRAVTTADYEQLVLAAFATQLGRVRALGEREPQAGALAPAPGHVTVIAIRVEAPWAPPTSVLEGVWQFLDARRLLTTHVHAIAPRIAELAIRATLYLVPDAPGEAARDDARAKVTAFVHPLTGGPDGTGWPFDRNLYLSDVRNLLQGITGVSHVEHVTMSIGGAPNVEEVDLQTYDVMVATCAIVAMEPVGYPVGVRWVPVV